MNRNHSNRAKRFPFFECFGEQDDPSPPPRAAQRVVRFGRRDAEPTAGNAPAGQGREAPAPRRTDPGRFAARCRGEAKPQPLPQQTHDRCTPPSAITRLKPRAGVPKQCCGRPFPPLPSAKTGALRVGTGSSAVAGLARRMISTNRRRNGGEQTQRPAMTAGEHDNPTLRIVVRATHRHVGLNGREAEHVQASASGPAPRRPKMTQYSLNRWMACPPVATRAKIDLRDNPTCRHVLVPTRRSVDCRSAFRDARAGPSVTVPCPSAGAGAPPAAGAVSVDKLPPIPPPRQRHSGAA